VLQAGIQQRLLPNGQALCIAWYEWFAPQQPNSPPYIFQTNIPNFPVLPGQSVSSSIQYTNNKTTGLINFGNNTTGQHFSITAALSPSRLGERRPPYAQETCPCPPDDDPCLTGRS
jgi:hypothetical protein